MKDREINSVELPPRKPLPMNLLFPSSMGGAPDVDLLKDFLVKEGKVMKDCVLHVANHVSELMSKNFTIIKLSYIRKGSEFVKT